MSGRPVDLKIYLSGKQIGQLKAITQNLAENDDDPNDWVGMLCGIALAAINDWIAKFERGEYGQPKAHA